MPKSYKKSSTRKLGQYLTGLSAAHLNQLFDGGSENLVDGWCAGIADIEDTVRATDESLVDRAAQVRRTEKEHVRVPSKWL